MKLRTHVKPAFAPFSVFLTLFVGLSTLTGCNDAAPDHDNAAPTAPGTSSVNPSSDSSRLGSIRSRADSAFAALDQVDAKRVPRTRSESRIGPQPWPADLPNAWPRFENAKVLADTRRNGDRLLLVNVPAGTEQAALEFEEALRDQGYEVDPLATRTGHALHAESTDHEVVLTFYPREKVTRLEILFPGKRAS